MDGESYCCENNGPIPYRCCPVSKSVCCPGGKCCETTDCCNNSPFIDVELEEMIFLRDLAQKKRLQKEMAGAA